tara:strand:- start:366 stop:497 length:132 start_codon:yes stop_codon:yes gene_type:complete
MDNEIKWSGGIKTGDEAEIRETRYVSIVYIRKDMILVSVCPQR